MKRFIEQQDNRIMKHYYIKPTLCVETFQKTNIICASARNVDGNAGLNSGITGGSGPARGRTFDGDGWDDED
jgi:hypothetical protein